MHLSNGTRLRSRKNLPLAYSSYLCRKPFPTELQDMVNNLSAEFQKSMHVRDLFESMIVANTVDDEPNAPRITIQNPVDYQPCPPMEFYYTNKLFHGPDITPSNPLNLQGCSCKGPCDSTNSSCACVQRHERLIKSLEGFTGFQGFVYNEEGLVKDLCLPIFECNAACTCSVRCSNRVSAYEPL